ncbi:glycosyltransferase family 4 protein [Thermoflexus sp.]|uniref:glycosyltransferase family 4 protein n=1 Tax=Thermoflexus sp. TaxID=1969742 RepID=UPI002ADDF11C|nr:glycosyltransferase family 4 protein [Thermoflexus sp.]
MKMKRIVRLVNLYPPYIVGGNEMLTHEIEEALRARGYEVHAITARGRKLDGLPFVHQAFHYSLDERDAIFLGGRSLTLLELFRHHVFAPSTYRNVRRLVRRLRPDLILVDNLYMASAAPLLAVRDAPCPVIAQVADRWLLFILRDWGLVLRPQTLMGRLFVNAVRAVIQRPIARRVRIDGIVTVSNFIRDLYIRSGFPPEIIETHYLGINTHVFRPGPEHPLGDPVRLLFAGSLWEGKGPQVAIRALRILSRMEGMPRFRLDLFGDGAEGFKQYLRRLIRDEGVEDQVVFHGFVPWPELVRAMHEADIFVFPSVWEEPFAITPLQAMGCGLPVIATTTGGTPEGFRDGETALLIPPNDPAALATAIVRLVQDPELRQRLRENGIREAYTRWRFEAYVDRLVDFYQRVFERWWREHTHADCADRA